MPSKEILWIRNCIHINVILHFHWELMSKSVSVKFFWTKTGKAGLYN